jgi:type VI protein secretion system component Hcp
LSSETFAYMHVKSSVQGEFLDDETQAGQQKTLCLAVRFRGDVPADARKGTYAVTQHEPITVIGEWSPSTVQFLTSLWNNEVIDEVGFDFVQQDTAGKDEVFATLTLNKVTVAFVELRSGNTLGLIGGELRTVDYIGFHAQKISFKLIGPKGPVEASYVRKASAT